MTIKNKITSCLMLKNENRFIFNEKYEKKPNKTMLEQCLDRVSQISDFIIVVDNGSDDGSLDVYKKYDKIILVKNNKNLSFSDYRDRKYLINEAKKTESKWMMMIDGDEVFEDRAVEWIREFAEKNYNPDKNIRVWFKYINLWRFRTKYRVDKWNSSKFSRMWTLDGLKINGADLHSYDITFENENITDYTSPFNVIHYGWADWKHRVDKSFRYAVQHAIQHKINLYESSRYYVKEDLSESEIVLNDVDPEWLEEFRR